MSVFGIFRIPILPLLIAGFVAGFFCGHRVAMILAVEPTPVAHGDVR